MKNQRISDSVATHISSRVSSDDKPVLKMGRERPLTLFHAIDQSSLSAPGKRPDRLLQEGMILLFAGGDTVGHTLSHIMFHLLDNPDIYSEIKTELDEATPAGETIPSLHTLERLPWLVLSSLFLLQLIIVLTFCNSLLQYAKDFGSPALYLLGCHRWLELSFTMVNGRYQQT